MAKITVEGRFTIVPNELINDKSVSFKAKGLYAYIHSKPNGWEFSSERIAQESSDGRDSVRNGLKELEASGWLVRIKRSAGFSNFETEYVLKAVRENSMTENTASKNTASNFPSSNKERNSNTESSKTEVESIAKKGFSPHTYSIQEIEVPEEVKEFQAVVLKQAREEFFEQIDKGIMEGLKEKFPQIPEKVLAIEARKFSMYWTETDMRGKPRWKKQPTFDPIRRFATWIYKTCEKMEEEKPRPQRVF